MNIVSCPLENQAIWDLFWNTTTLVAFIALYSFGYALKATPAFPNELIPWAVGAVGLCVGVFYFPGRCVPDAWIGGMVGTFLAGMAVFGYNLLKGLLEILLKARRFVAADEPESKGKGGADGPSTLGRVSVLAPLLCSLALFSGCATPGATTDPAGEAQRAKIEQIVAQYQDVIGSLVSVAKNYALKAAIKDPAKSQDLIARLHDLGVIVDGLRAKKQFDPVAFRNVFRIKEAEIDQALAFVPTVYAAIGAATHADPVILDETMAIIAGGLK